MYKKNIPPLAWGKILRDFDLATKAKKYKRVDYRTIWTKIAKPNRNVHIEVQENDMSIMIDDNNKNIDGALSCNLNGIVFINNNDLKDKLTYFLKK